MRRKTRLEKVRRKRKEVLAIAKKHGATNVRVFGSIVRGTDSAQSDVDFLVRVVGQPGPWFPAGMSRELAELLGCPLDIVTEPALYPDFRKFVLKEAVQL